MLVKRILSEYPSSVQETNCFGQTPLHLSVISPQCLDVLLKFNCDINASDCNGNPAIYYAMALRMTRSVEKLLVADCEIPTSCLQLPFDAAFTRNVIQALKQRRDQMKNIGLFHLPTSQARDFGLLQDSTLDYHFFQVHEHLQELRVTIPRAIAPSERAHPVDPVYSAICTPSYLRGVSLVRKLDLLWEAGFRDLDAVVAWRHRLPILHLVSSSFGTQNVLRWLPSILWLMQHGADIYTTIEHPPREAGLTAAHLIMAAVPTWWQFLREPSELEIVRQIFKTCHAEDPEDSCLCFCSGKGCTPFTCFAKRLCLVGPVFDAFGFPSCTQTLERHAPTKIQRLLLSILEQLDLSLDHWKDTIRIVTFQTLELRHTCCDITPAGICPGCRVSDDDVDEINDEQEGRLAIFEDLVSELLEDFCQDRGDGKEFGITRREEFWSEYWLPKVSRIREDWNEVELTEEEKLAAEDAGVVWHGYSQKEERRRIKRRRRWTVEKFRLRVEKIIAEA